MNTTDDTNAARRGSGSNDLLGPASEARWYCLDRDGVAMLCKDEADARAQVSENDDCWPGRAPHRAALLGDVRALHAELRHARDGLTKGRSRMREDNERLRAALLRCARQAEALKRECGMNPESPQAIRNAQYQSISTTAHIALGTIRGPEGA